MDKKFVKPKITGLTLKNFRDKMVAAAKEAGCIWENFGQVELAKLKEKYKYNPYANQWSKKREWDVKREIEHLSGWCANYSPKDL